QILNLVEIVNKQVITPTSAKVIEKTYVICGGAHAYYDCIATDSNQPSVCAAFGAKQSKQGEMKVVTTHSGLAYEGPPIPINSPLEKIVEQDTEETTDEEHSIQFKEYLECSFHAITPILPTKEPEYSLRECEVTSEDKRECDVPVCENSFFDDHYEILSDLNNDDISSDDDAFKDIEYVEASLPIQRMSA
nr:hypothetical protein [Tanacetum cinerariifolium]